MSPRPVELPPPEFEGPLRLAHEGRAAEALSAIEAALAADPNRESRASAAAAALAEISRQAEGRLDLTTAERALDLALGHCPGYADLHFERARLLLALHRRPEARHALDQAVRLNPRYHAARLERALLDAREGLIGRALSALRELASEIPEGEAQVFQQGIEKLEQADWEQAEPLLKRAMELSSPDLKGPLESVHRHLARGEAAEAIRVLHQVMPDYERYPDLHYLIGLSELKLGHFDDAMASLARALELNPDFHDARVQFARALECVGETAHAARQLALVLEFEPDHRRALELRSTWLERYGGDPRRRRGLAAEFHEGQAEEKPAA